MQQVIAYVEEETKPDARGKKAIVHQSVLLIYDVSTGRSYGDCFIILRGPFTVERN